MLLEDAIQGADYIPQRDGPRLVSQLQRVEGVMSDHNWRTVKELCDTLKQLYPLNDFPEDSIQAQLRNLRKLGHTVDRQYIGLGVYQYKLV